ncbi:TetR family transcriptional regulator [Brevibacillus choshinensis]|uniref:TetR family transcriptional regulator n=1 Tax=Brevibacillus choshinensis TaxID=54911 RepID=A0ABR5N5Q5_BRECH|nr:TetR/AcrR family transcriptional regulator [Brevibacillus choshinensis]KQL45942.1 TetR family transcriptional regulator [Brevibacillus choshinensis]
MITIWQDEQMETNKRKLLEAALLEFAEKGYEAGSTNQIVQSAGVSKGMLFHYFSTKKTLFLAVVDACVESFFTHLDTHLSERSQDLLERLVQIQRVKLDLFVEQPYMYQMAISTFIDFPAACRDEVKEREEDFNQRYYSLFLDGIDLSMLREQVDVKQSLSFILAAIEAVTQKHVRDNYQAQDKGLEQLTLFHEDITRYCDLIRFGLYKQHGCP